MSAAPQLDPNVVPFDSAPLRGAAGVTSSSARAAARRRPVSVTDIAGREQSAILVVEPDARTRSVLEVGLNRAGFDVIATASAEEAIRFLGPDRPLPAMIFSEAELRVTDGFSFCAQVRADQRTADLPVVLLSRTSEAWHRELAGGAGADQYLPKPLFLNDVVALARLMAGHSSWAAKFSSDTDALAVVQVLRAMLSGVRSGRLELADGSGWLSFRDGCVIDAGFETARGGEALRRLLLLGRGAYTVSFAPALARATMTFGLEDLCGRTHQQLQRWQRLMQVAVPLESVLVVDFVRLAEELERLPDQVNELVRLSDGHRSVREVIIECSLDEVTALEAVTRLYAMGVLARPEAVSTTPARAVGFFSADAAIVEAIEPAMQRQLDAFRMQPVVEAPAPRTGPAPESEELSAFVRDGRLEEGAGLAAAISPDAELEAEFFAHTEPDAKPESDRASASGSGWIIGAAVLVSSAAILGAAAWTRAPRAPGASVESPSAESRPVKAVEALAAVPAAVPGVARLQPSPPVLEVRPEPVPVEAKPHLAEGIALYEAGNIREAAAILDGVTRREPGSAQAWLYLGLARFDLNDSVGAEEAAMKAFELDPRSGRALILLASVYLAAGQEAKAEMELRRYLELEPNGAYARDAQQLLRR